MLALLWLNNAWGIIRRTAGEFLIRDGLLFAFLNVTHRVSRRLQRFRFYFCTTHALINGD
jgi:hypothetical protein